MLTFFFNAETYVKCTFSPSAHSHREKANTKSANANNCCRCSTETSGGHEVNFDVNVQNDEAQQMPVEMYELVPVAEDSDYESDYNSDDEKC